MFIGSSTEGLAVAEAMQLNLDHTCEAMVWSQGVFGLGQGTLEALADRLGDFDFAALVLTPDDITISREQMAQAPRDNVLLELGMFIGALGRERTFIIYDRESQIKLPSDLAGVTPATYAKHSSGNLQSSLGAATTQIKTAIERLGKKTPKIMANVDENTTFQIIHDLLNETPEQFIIWMHVTDNKLVRTFRSFSGGIAYSYLMRNGSSGHGGFSIDELCNKLADAGLLQVNLRNEVTLTLRGHAFAQWLIDNGHKADYFKSDVGTWGAIPHNYVFPWNFKSELGSADANVRPTT